MVSKIDIGASEIKKTDEAEPEPQLGGGGQKEAAPPRKKFCPL